LPTGLSGRAGEEGLGEVTGGRGGYGSGLGYGWRKGISAQILRLLHTLLPRAVFVNHTHNQLAQVSSSQKKNSKLQYWIKPPTLKEEDSSNQGQQKQPSKEHQKTPNRSQYNAAKSILTTTKKKSYLEARGNSSR